MILESRFADEARTAWVRSQLGFISQEPILFALTIKENVEYGLQEVDGRDERIKEATAAANVDDFANHLPLGLDTPSGERGGDGSK